MVELNNLCRICLKDSQFYSNIFEEILMEGYLVHDIIKNLYDVESCVRDGLPEYVCIECLATLKEFMLFKKKAMKGRSALLLLKHRTENGIFEPILLQFRRDVNSKKELITSQRSKCSSGTVEGAFPDDVEISDDFDSTKVTVKEEPIEKDAIESQTSECFSGAVGSTFPDAAESSEDFSAMEVTVKEEPLEAEIIETPTFGFHSGADEGIFPDTANITGDSSITGVPVKQDPEKDEAIKSQAFEYRLGAVEGIFPDTADVSRDSSITGASVEQDCGQVSNPQALHAWTQFGQEEGSGEIPREGETGCLGDEQSHPVSCAGINASNKHTKCEVCGIAFGYKYQLVEHYATHIGYKPYECKVCRKRFYKRGVLIVHSKIHSGVRPYECEVCRMTFVQKCHLKSHQETHDPDKAHQCEVCGSMVLHKRNFWRHMKVHAERNELHLRFRDFIP